MPVFLEVRKYFERAPYFFLALLTSKYSGVNFRIEFCRRSWWKIRGSLHQDDSGRDQPGGAQIVRALVQLHREVLGHVPGDVEGIHRGGQTGDQEDGATGDMRRRVKMNTRVKAAMGTKTTRATTTTASPTRSASSTSKSMASTSS